MFAMQTEDQLCVEHNGNCFCHKWVSVWVRRHVKFLVPRCIRRHCGSSFFYFIPPAHLGCGVWKQVGLRTTFILRGIGISEFVQRSFSNVCCWFDSLQRIPSNHCKVTKCLFHCSFRRVNSWLEVWWDDVWNADGVWLCYVERICSSRSLSVDACQMISCSWRRVIFFWICFSRSSGHVAMGCVIGCDINGFLFCRWFLSVGEFFLCMFVLKIVAAFLSEEEACHCTIVLLIDWFHWPLVIAIVIASDSLSIV